MTKIWRVCIFMFLCVRRPVWGWFGVKVLNLISLLLSLSLSRQHRAHRLRRRQRSGRGQTRRRAAAAVVLVMVTRRRRRPVGRPNRRTAGAATAAKPN